MNKNLQEKHLFLAPHQDDETNSMGISVMRNTYGALLVFVTNGAPDFKEDYFLNAGYPSRKKYKEARYEEALSAAKLLGLKEDQVLFLGFDDQGVHKEIPEIIRQVTEIIQKHRITHTHTFCYEGHQPDHEVIRFAAWFAVKTTDTKLIEHSANLIRNQTFDIPKKDSFTIHDPTEEEKKIRRKIISEVYPSQGLDPELYKDIEFVREATDNDYSILENAKELRFESIKAIKLTREDILSAFKEYENTTTKQ